MKNSSSLITAAMLTSYLKVSQKEYLDLLKPFILNLVPKKYNSVIDLNHIKDEMECKYGFSDLPINIIDNILLRASKDDNSVIQKDKRGYFVSRENSDDEFEDTRKNIKRSIDAVLEALSEYFKVYTSEKNMKKIEVDNAFNGFLESYGYNVIDNVDDLRTLTIKDNLNYHVARFIIGEYSKESEIFDKILEIVKGFFVYKAIYFFSVDNKQDMDIKLDGTEVYFDTRLLINILGYNTEKETQATRELCDLILESGGKLFTFYHNRDELAGILTKYAKDPYTRTSMSLDYFDRNNYDEEDVLRHRSSIEINLSKYKVNIVEAPYQDASSEERLEDRGFIDQVELKKYIESVYIRSSNEINPERIDRDIDSVAAISMIRGKERICGIESCKAIFVTNNLTLSRAVRFFFKDRFSKGEISFFINSLDLTALLWLRTFDKKIDIASLKLLENAYAALRPSNKLIDTFKEKVVLMQSEGEISPIEAVMLRTQPIVTKVLAELTENDPERISSETVKEAKNRYEKHLVEQKDKEIVELTKEMSEAEIIFQSELASKECELRKEREKKQRAIIKAQADSEEKSESYIKLLRKFINIASVIIFLIGSYAYYLDFDSKGFSLYSTIILCFSVGGVSGITLKKIDFIETRITSLKHSIFDKEYKKEIDKINKLFE